MTTAVEGDKDIDRLWLVKKAYLMGLLGSMIVVLLGLLASFLINRFYPLGSCAIGLFQAFSVVPGSASLFGVKDWDLHTWGRQTPAELLNHKLFIRLSLISLFLPIVAFSLEPRESLESVLEMEARILEKLRAEIREEHMEVIPFAAKRTFE